MYHSFINHSSADGHLGCFHVLAMINSAAINIRVHVSLSDPVSSVCMPRSGISGSYSSSISSFFKESPHCFPQWLYQFAYDLDKTCYIFNSRHGMAITVDYTHATPLTILISQSSIRVILFKDMLQRSEFIVSS